LEKNLFPHLKHEANCENFKNVFFQKKRRKNISNKKQHPFFFQKKETRSCSPFFQKNLFLFAMPTSHNFPKLPRNLTRGEEVLFYFATTQNAYTSFLFEKEKEQAWLSAQQKKNHDFSFEKRALPPGFEMHHKIPKYSNGPDIPENLLPLSYEDHTLAHKLLYEVYGNYYDFCVYNMRIGKTKEAHHLFRQGVVNQMRELKQGRFNSENQKKCGLKNKGIVKRPHAKNPCILAAFEKGMFWISDTGEEVHIPPRSLQSVSQLTEKLLFAFSEKHQHNFRVQGSRSYPYCGINRILSGWHDPKTKKCLFRVGPWRLGGLYVDDNSFSR
jgi:hypothetical protein